MAAEILLALIRLNLVLGLAILAVLVLRVPVRRTFGVHSAYALWGAIPLAVLGCFMPAAPAAGPLGLLEQASQGGLNWLSAAGRGELLLQLWLAGVVVSLALAAISQFRFLLAEKAGRAGPAAVGFVQPRLVAPADFAERFTPEEWRLVRAHERAHIDRLDGRRTAVAALAQCLFWFNPMMHLAIRALRLDQELACDATVISRMPHARRRYAETLLRTQLDVCEPTFGASWRGRGSIEARLAMLAARPPSMRRLDQGLILVMMLWSTAFVGAWSAQPRQQTGPLGLVLSYQYYQNTVTAPVTVNLPSLRR